MPDDPQSRSSSLLPSPPVLDQLPERIRAGTVASPCSCLLWTGAMSRRGYGVLRHEGGTAYAHRIAWIALHGPVPDGMVLDHLCRNPACVNPDHLEPVTQQENVRRGSSTRLNADQVLAIRILHEAGVDPAVLARTYGVSRAHVLRILRGSAWNTCDEASRSN